MKAFGTTLRQLRSRRGFTVLELFAAMAIIAILMGLLFPVIGSARESARRSKAKTDLLQIESALRAYHGDYDAYPVSLELRKTEVSFATNNSDLINALRAIPEGANANHALNPRQVIYLHPPIAGDPQRPRSGVFKGCWYDPWGPESGKPESGVYHVRIAAPDRHQVTNPYPGGDTPGGDGDADEKEEKNEGSEKEEAPLINADVISWSLGKGGVQTYELRDQIISWK